MTDTVLFQAFVYLLAAVVCVPIAKRLGLGAVLGYLVAGVLVGPNVLGAIGGEGAHVMHFAEFGVVLMLFVVGLELQPSLWWRLRRFCPSSGRPTTSRNSSSPTACSRPRGSIGWARTSLGATCCQ